MPTAVDAEAKNKEKKIWNVNLNYWSHQKETNV